MIVSHSRGSVRLAGALLCMHGLISTTCAAEEAGQIEEITVTANKLSTQRLQDAPLTIQAISSDLLQNLGVTNFADWSRMVPGLGFTDRGPGDKRYIIRGVNSTGAGTVGVYYDEAVITGGNKEDGGGRNVDIKLHDIERIEVLKGPQGTLYGANSLSGTVRVLTRQPNPSRIEGEFGAQMSGTEDGGFNYDVNGMINLPIVADRVAVRAVGWTVNNDGFIDNIHFHRNNLNYERTDGARITLSAVLAEGLKLTLSSTSQDMRTGAPAHYEPASGDLKSNEYGLNPWSDRARILSAVLQYDTAIGTFTAATDEFNRKINYFQDTTRFFAALFKVPPDQCCYAFGFGPSVTTQPQTRELHDTEIRFASKLPGPVQFVIGGFREIDHRDFDSGTLQVVPATGEPIVPYSYFFHRHASQYIRQSAGFGELTFDITSKLQAVAGVRYFTASLYGDGYGIVDFPNKPPAPPKPPVTADNSKVTKKFGLSYKLSPDALLYATASQGFRIGGVNDPGITLISNLPPGFGPDQVWMYELGAKTEWLDRHLLANASIYTLRWSDMQTQTLDKSQFVFTTNAGRAQIDGLELELTARPLEELTVTLGANYSNARLTQDQPTLTQTSFTGLDGDRIPNVPKLTGSLTAEYVRNLGGELQGVSVLDYSYTGSSRTTFRPNDPISRELFAYSLLNVRFGVRNAKWETMLFVDNVANARPRVDILVNTVGLERIYTVRPRTLGLSANYRF